MSRPNQPRYHQRSPETQPYGKLVNLPVGLSDDARAQACQDLNQCLADTMTLRDMYKKHHWQLSGPTFYPLHLLFDEHYEGQAKLVDAIAERIQILGGISLAMPHDVAEETNIPRPPRGREEPPVQISRLLEAHELILKFAREAARRASDAGDEGTNDLFVSEVIRSNEMQVWFLAEHLVPVALVDVGSDKQQPTQPPGASPPPGPHR